AGSASEGRDYPRLRFRLVCQIAPRELLRSIFRIRTRTRSPVVPDLFLVNCKTRLQVVWQRGWMVLSVGVQPQALRAVAPGFVDSPLQKVLTQTLADKLRHQAEERNLDLAVD